MMRQIENIYKNIKSYEDAAGYGPGQVDPKLLDAMQSKQGIVDSLVVWSRTGQRGSHGRLWF